MLAPKLFSTLKGYSKEQFIKDAVAGIIVGIIAIPLAIAFAIASGVSPDKGLVTAVVAGFIISAVGGSRVQIGGPTGAFVVIVYAIVQKYGIEGLIVATFLAGILLIIMGVARLGTIIKFIPHSVVVGFTSGIAVIIFSSQVKDFLGLHIDNLPAEFLAKWQSLAHSLGSTNPAALFIAVLSILIIVICPKISRRLPGALIAILVTSGIVILFKLPVETIGTRFGQLPHTLPLPRLPKMSLQMVQTLFQAAFTIAILGGIESLLSAVVSDGMIGGKHRSNMELIAQGCANVFSSLFGGMPATGAIARTATNVKSGGRTPIAGIIHAVTIFLTMLFFGRFISYVPMACLAGVLIVVAYHMSEWRSFLDLLKASRGAMIVLLATFSVTIFIDLPAAIELGVVLSAFLFMKRMSDATQITIIANQIADDDRNGEELTPKISLPKGVEIYEISGPLFFAAANRFEETDRAISEKPKVRILRFRDVPIIDSTGMYALKTFYKNCKKGNIGLVITGLHVQPLNEMVKSSLYDLIGEENVCSSLKESVERAKALLGAR